MAVVDYYQILQVAPNAHWNDIKVAYRSLAKKYHPDVNTDKQSHKQFLLIKEAYYVLIHPELREQYHLKYFGTPLNVENVLTPALILRKLKRTYKQVNAINIHAISYDWLLASLKSCINQHTVLLLSKHKQDPINENIASQMLLLIELLPFKYAQSFYDLTKEFLVDNSTLAQHVVNQKKNHFWQYLFDKYKLPAAIIIALVLCVVFAYVVM